MLAKVSAIDVRLEIIYKKINDRGERAGGDVPQVAEVIREVPTELSNDGEIVLARIITYLKTLGYDLDEAEVWFYSRIYEEYVYCEKDPISRVLLARTSDLVNNCLTIRVRINREISDTLGTKSTEESKGEDKYNAPRVKERELTEIIHKVKKWRDLYRGYLDKDGRRVKYSLEDAAKLVKLPKKTLDDYLQQLKLGKKFGFDFSANQHGKIGVLREFIKEKMKKPKNGGESREALNKEEAD
eukprot:TRINITY_DN9338_c0_g7_i1.p1 TRINITY_DN9338_c0_g7~~TRINITY_DN9338_c0_g7_i1.p1  ORF type:complete len:242 (+),score=85.20 TRINITY_DN9338_c0_g7_i1:136-861(+)